jgi:hypothetical protein
MHRLEIRSEPGYAIGRGYGDRDRNLPADVIVHDIWTVGIDEIGTE